MLAVGINSLQPTLFLTSRLNRLKLTFRFVKIKNILFSLTWNCKSNGK